nr:hypothetical protein [Pseudomarimonas arenosa]
MGGGRDKAEAQAKAIAELDAAEGKVAAANLALQDDSDSTAESLYREALRANPASIRALFGFNAFLQNRKRFDDVRTLWVDALDHEKTLALGRYQLGRLAAITGDHIEQGLAYLDAFIAAGEEPEQLSLAAAQWRRGQLLDKLGRRDEAIAAFELAMNDRDVGEMAKADLKRVKQG